MSALASIIAVAGTISLQQSARGRLTDEELQRVELVAAVERSAVLVLAERRLPYGEESGKRQRTAAMGAGVIVRSEGLVVTAAHVVVAAERVVVKLEGGEPLTARIVFLDVASDVALLRLETPPPGLVAAQLGDSDRVRKGETVYVIGNPTGLERSLSVGVVSGRHTLGHIVGGSLEAEVIQTDAAVNPGNSGGPIFNSRGELIAVAQLIISRSGGSDGLGFGLAVNVVKKILALDPCTWLGFSGIALNERLAAALNVPRSGGVLVQMVSPGSPAAQAGLKEGDLLGRIGDDLVLVGGDVVLEVNGMPFLDWVRKRQTGGKPGDRHEFRFLVLRGGRLVEVPIVSVHRAAW